MKIKKISEMIGDQEMSQKKDRMKLIGMIKKIKGPESNPSRW